EELERALPAVLETELALTCQVLRAAVATEVFRYGLVQGSAVLAEQLRKWLEAPREGFPERRVLLRLAKYLSRVVAKTSPYATFTLVGAGRWSTEGPALVAADADAWCGVVDLNGWATQHLARLLLAWPEILDRQPVRINPSIWRDGAKLWFLGHDPGEPLCGVTASTAVRECVEFVRATPGATVGALCEHLSALGEDDDGQHRALVGRLIALGLVEPVMPVADQALDPLGRLSAWLVEVDHVDGGANGGRCGRIRLWRRALRELDARLRAYPGLTIPDERVAAHDLIRAILTELVSGVPGPGSDHQSQPPAGHLSLPRKNLTDENAVLTGRAQTCGLEHWRAALADLETVRVLSGLFCQALPIRLMAAKFFTAIAGGSGEVSFLDFYRSVRTVAGSAPDSIAAASGGLELLDFLRGGAGQPLGDRGWETLERLNRLRRQTVRLLRAHPADGCGVITVDPAVVTREAGGWPAWVRVPGSIACHVQALLDSQGLVKLVLNGVATGYGSSRGRLSYLLERAGREPGAPGRVTDVSAISAAAPDGARSVKDPVLVEVRGLFGSNLNRCPPLAHYELDYPGVSSDRPTAQRIGLPELVVQLDTAEGLLRLVCPRLGMEIRPVHLGAMSEFLLPPALRLLIAVFGDQATPALPTWRLYTDPDPWPQAGVAVLPRVELGRITLARAAWYVRARELAWRGKGEPDARYALRLIERLDELGVPQRCYVRVIPERAWRREALDVSKAHKPIYLDQASWLSLTVFERTLESPDDRIVFHEALPDLAQAPHYPGQGARVSEYVIEVPGSGHE
ncbi:MAG TPA: lantibiotic dehydratase, partial [Pseudonocardiaceae bacterium]|nr:lantibiotic dehydratase [Pseudonocardiaceae bacterium]